MVKTRTTDVPDPRGVAPPVARGRDRGRGMAPARGRGQGRPRVAPSVPPADPIEVAAETSPADFMSTPGFQEVGLFPADPATSQAGGGEHAHTAQAPGHAAAIYQTSGALPVGGAQPVAAAVPGPRPAAACEPQKLLDKWTRLHPPVFGDEQHEDPQDFIDRCRDRLYNMSILKSHGVDFTTFQLEGRARRWWQSHLLGRPVGSPPMTWDQFIRSFLDRYIPPSRREELRSQFEQLRHDQMSVTDYELVVEIYRRIKGYRQRDREQMLRDKRFRHSGGFSGAPSGGRGQFGRGQSSGPTYPVPPPPRDAPVRPYFSAMPESFYRPPAIQGSSSGYLGHQGQTSGKQFIVTRGYYECGDPGHMKRFCPRLRGRAVQQGHQPMITAPPATPAIRPPRGRGQVGRGHPKGGGQAGGGHPGGAPARFYAFPARLDAVASDAVITGTISVCGRDASILFDPGSTYSYVSSLFAYFLDVPRESLGTPVYVSILVGDSVVVDQIYLLIYVSCVVTFYGYETRMDLLLLDMTDFEVILGMD
ncbi:uncharacterized protein [Nicotiana tomentosiformis]|uniref:uncharacterized protein n=1 Tax=Nicotiana tomentosiformis TaxID=4098 RepID=UPI00388C4E1A